MTNGPPNRSSVVARGAALAAALLSLALVTVATDRAAGQSSRNLAHQAEEAKTRAAEARAQEQALAGDIATQSERIDAVEGQVGALRSELAQLEAELDRSRSVLRALEGELAEKTRTLARAGARSARRNSSSAGASSRSTHLMNRTRSRLLWGRSRLTT